VRFMGKSMQPYMPLAAERHSVRWTAIEEMPSGPAGAR
jgi:hypothetical protein